MKVRIAILVLLIVSMLLTSAALALAAPSTFEPAGNGATTNRTYVLTSLGWKVTGSVSGDHYLLSSLPTGLTGSGCCCIYLPCVTRSQNGATAP